MSNITIEDEIKELKQIKRQNEETLPNLSYRLSKYKMERRRLRIERLAATIKRLEKFKAMKGQQEELFV